MWTFDKFSPERRPCFQRSLNGDYVDLYTRGSTLDGSLPSDVCPGPKAPRHRFLKILLDSTKIRILEGRLSTSTKASMCPHRTRPNIRKINSKRS